MPSLTSKMKSSGLMLTLLFLLGMSGAEAIARASELQKNAPLTGVKLPQGKNMLQHGHSAEPMAPSLPAPPEAELPEVMQELTLFWWLSRGHFRGNLRGDPGSPGHFFRSATFHIWVPFFILWICLILLSVYIRSLELTRWTDHLAALGLWIGVAMLVSGVVYLQMGEDSFAQWMDGYAIELILSMENVFLYEMILVSFKVPLRNSKKALFVTSLFQMVFQMILFMGIASTIEKITVLPYFLGAWLMFVGFQSLREDDHESFDATDSDTFLAMAFAMGERLLPEYTAKGDIFVYRDGKLRMTMLGPVVGSLLVIMFCMEVDVTLTKIEEIEVEYLAWTSSVLAAFALPELYVVVSELFRRFYLLKTGIGVLLLFFGATLLMRKEIELPSSLELVTMVSILFGSMVLSQMLGYSERAGELYEIKSDKSEDSDENEGLAAQALYFAS
eukprot:gb/GFBE01028896.1/.p1 GENE.gb/GFBE01028896.1/~~gb/GFBE01028896.1/.p1  ORF type:complete len:445 (+),score=81.70 gb/GFBE01028896.1/:1-1335(+)